MYLIKRTNGQTSKRTKKETMIDMGKLKQVIIDVEVRDIV